MNQSALLMPLRKNEMGLEGATEHGLPKQSLPVLADSQALSRGSIAQPYQGTRNQAVAQATAEDSALELCQC